MTFVEIGALRVKEIVLTSLICFQSLIFNPEIVNI